MKNNKFPKKPSAPSLWLWGIHACLAALQNPERRCLRLVVTPATLKEIPFLESDLACKKEVVEGAVLGRLLPPGAVHQGLALEVLPLPEPSFEALSKASEGVVVALDQVTDPHNVGAILRTAKALGTLGVIMTEHNAPPLSGVLGKAASGALDSLPIWKVTNLVRALEDLKKEGFWTVGLEEKAPAFLSHKDLPPKSILVMGAEGEGLRRLTHEKCDFLRKLPTDPAFSTLNVSVATAIALYELKRPLTL